MKLEKLMLTGILVAPLLSLLFIGKRELKRFFPGALLISLVVVMESVVAHRRAWWWFYKRLHPKIMGEIPLIFGPFFAGSLWILKLTYGNILKYLVSNFAVDSFFVYVMLPLFKKIGYASLVRLKKFQFLSIFTFKSVMLYAFQIFTEKIKHREELGY